MASKREYSKVHKALKKLRSSSIMFLEDKFRNSLGSEFEATVQSQFFKNAKGKQLKVNTSDFRTAQKLEETRKYLINCWNDLKNSQRVFSADVPNISESEHEISSTSEVEDRTTIPPSSNLKKPQESEEPSKTSGRLRKALTDFDKIEVDRVLDVKPDTLKDLMQNQKDAIFDMFPHVQVSPEQFLQDPFVVITVECGLSVDAHLVSKLGQICKDMAYNRTAQHSDCRFYFLVTNGEKDSCIEMQKKIVEIVKALQKPDYKDDLHDATQRKLYDAVNLTKYIAERESFKVFFCYHEFYEYCTKGDLNAIDGYIKYLEQQADKASALEDQVKEMRREIDQRNLLYDKEILQLKEIVAKFEERERNFNDVKESFRKTFEKFSEVQPLFNEMKTKFELE